jgi:geranylgeranyl diphosphate synthase type II
MGTEDYEKIIQRMHPDGQRGALLASSARYFQRVGGAGVYEERAGRGHGKLLLHETLLEEYLNGIEFSTDARLSGLVRAMRRPLLLGWGGRLHGLLCMESASGFGLDAAEVLPAAAAVELVHTICVIHNALPALGRDTPEVSACLEDVDQATAILAGDGFFGESLGLLTRHQKGPSARVLAAVRELARSTGVEGMVGGQSLGLDGSPDGDPDEVYGLRRGVLLGAAARIGAVLAGASREEQDAVAEYAWHLGVCHRVSLELSGEAGERIFTRALGGGGARRRAEEAASRAVRSLGRLDREMEGLRQLVRYAWHDPDEDSRGGR